MKQGPNVRRLIVLKMSRDAIPANGGLADGLKFLSSKESIADGVKRAEAWVEEAIADVKSAPDNPLGDDDEAIAGEILRRMDERRRP